MKNKKCLIFSLFALIVFSSFGQKGSKTVYYFGDPIVVDSSSTIILPTLYNSNFISTNKIALWGDFYANIIFYDFISDRSKKLFDKETYIVSFDNPYNSYRYNAKPNHDNLTSQWIFYRVKNIDHNKSGRIDNNDPAILYVSDIHGDNLKALTTESENVINIHIFENQNFALIKIQLDLDNDGDFEAEDRDFYFIKVDLKTLTLGNKIETK